MLFPFELADEPAAGACIKGGCFFGPETGLLDFPLVQVIGDAGAASGAADGSFPFLYVQIKKRNLLPAGMAYESKSHRTTSNLFQYNT